MENANEMHFYFNMDNGWTLGIRGDETIKYADVTSGGEGMTMMVRISGRKEYLVENPFMKLKSKDGNYPIRGAEDYVPGISYRTGPQGWIDSRVMKENVLVKRALLPLPNGTKCVLSTDNCGGHKKFEDLEDSLTASDTEICFFTANAADLPQHADSFLCKNIKSGVESALGRAQSPHASSCNSSNHAKYIWFIAESQKTLLFTVKSE